jgi:hypothetical protein
MDGLKAQLQGNKQELLLNVVKIEAVITFALVICSFVVAATANAGFNCVLTGFLNAAFVGGSYYVLKNSKAPIAIGFLIGTAGMMAFMNFMAAIYWGQLSRCETLSYSIAQYSCSNRSAYGAVSAFSVFLFLLESAFTVGVILWRGELINEAGGYDEISSSNPYDASASAGYPNTAPSADL